MCYMARERTFTYVSVQLSQAEKTILDSAAKAAGVNRNRFIRSWIASLAIKENRDLAARDAQEPRP